MKSLDIENLALRKRIFVQMYFQQYFFIQYLLDLKEAAVIRNFSSSFHNLIFFQPTAGGAAGGICVAGRIESGFVMPNDRVVIMPAG